MSSSRGYKFRFEGLKRKAIERACNISILAHNSVEKPYIVEELSDKNLSGYTVIAFPGSWSVEDWYAGDKPFGETKVDLKLFPCMRSIRNYHEGNNDKEVARVNQAFLQRFLRIKDDQSKASFCSDVEGAVKDKKRIIFAGHSSGGPIAIFATIWFFEEYIRLKRIPTCHPFCLTFGSPLTADRIFGHAVRREKWSDYFVNFVSRYDIVPRILFAPLSSIKDELPQILSYINPVSPSYASVGTRDDTAENFFMKVMDNASTEVLYDANLLWCGHIFDRALFRSIGPSPYRPFGTYVYCLENGKLLAVKNPSAVFQLLFYSSRLMTEEECPEIAPKSLKCHLAYGAELQRCMKMEVLLFDKAKLIPMVWGIGEKVDDQTKATFKVVDDLILRDFESMRSLLSTMESEMLKRDNQLKFEKLIPKRTVEEKKEDDDGDRIKELMETLENYRKTSCETRGIGYYDSFKISQFDDDFQANAARLKLVGIWDEIIDKLRNYELPDTFEGEESWIELGTQFRRLVEPVDIANFYRHNKYVDSGPYINEDVRPRRYRYTQRWLEHSKKLPRDSCGESCFWAYLEQDLVEADKNNTLYINVTDKVKEVDKNLKKWYDDGLINKDVFFQNSTLIKWWNRLPKSHREVSCIKEIIQLYAA